MRSIKLPLPLYYTIIEYIVKKIEEKELRPDDPIPSEREMMEKFNVSRTTVRKAIDVLVSNGYIYKVQGKGTFVQSKKIEQGLIKLTSCTEGIRNLGLTPSKKLLNQAVTMPSKYIAGHLNIKENEKVFVTNRVLYGNKLPINYTKSHIVYKYVKGIENYEFGKNSIYNTIETQFNIKITHAIRTIEAVLANKVDTKLLNVTQGSPILVFNGVVYGEKNEVEFPLEYFISRYRCDKTKFYIEQYR